MTGFWKGFAAALVLVALLWLVVVAQYADYIARSRSSEAIASVGALKASIENRALSQASLAGVGTGIDLAPFRSQHITRMHLTADGVILMQIDSDGATIALVPRMEGETVKWRCFGGSTHDVPTSCTRD